MASIGRFLATSYDLASDFFYPKQCVLCSKYGSFLCGECAKKFPPARLKCIKCNRKNPFGQYCPNCKSKYSPDLVISCVGYDPTVKRVIALFKYQDATILVAPLAQLIENMIAKIPNFDQYVLVPIPLSSKRLLFRGYNQSELLCRHISTHLNIKLENILARKQSPQTQALSESSKARHNNVKGVFSLRTATIPAKIILLDDVITTGATIEEATKVLKIAGANEVIVVSLALA